jgi:phenylacetate-CoA ligase
MPVIRYRTRDLTRLLPGTARTMRRMQKVTGRTDDMLIVRGVNLFPTQIEELLLETRLLSGHYRMVLTREGRMDEIMVEVEAHSHGHDPALLDREASAIVARIKDRIGLSTRVVIHPPGVLERSLGKARRVMDRRSEGR